MEQVIVGVFDNQSQVDRARQALIDAGYPDSAMSVHATDESRETTAEVDDDAEESGIAHFFRKLFGMEKHRDSANLYAEAVRRGHYVLTVHSTDAAQVDRAQDILEECGAIDVDERSTEWSEQDETRNQQRETANPRLETTNRMTAPASAEAVDDVETRQGARKPAGNKAQIPVVEEELRVGKREVSRGGVRVFARMSETPAEETVQLREEHATVERRPVNRPATEADFAAFKEGSIEVREMAEEAVIDKQARVVEEVHVGKETTQREETVRDSVRHTDVQVDRLGDESKTQRGSAMNAGDQRNFADDNEADYRAHWQSNYANAGTYDEYAPAYTYGSSLGGDERYHGRSWDEIEPDARRDWETRYPNSTWERFKDSVRHGWERLTGSAGTPTRGSDRATQRPRA
jgi:uncharacterized protein (TIGR02271 family)